MKKMVAFALVLSILLCSVPALAADRAYYLGIDFTRYTEEWLKNNGYSESKAAAILMLAEQAQEMKTDLIEAIASHTEQSKEDAETKVNEIIELMAVKSVYEYMVSGSKLSESDVAAFQKERQDLENSITMLRVNMRGGKTAMSEDEWESLTKKSYSTQLAYAAVSYHLDGAAISPTSIKLIRTEQSTVSGMAQAQIIVAMLGSNFTREQKDEITKDFSNLGELSALLLFIVDSKLI